MTVESGESERLSDQAPRQRGRSAVWIAVAVAGFLAIGFLLFPGSSWDDSYITYWPAHTLAQHGAILNYNGDRVEQSSTLGLVLILGVLAWCTGIEVSILGKLASIGLGAAAVVATARLARAVEPRLAAGAAAILATTTYFVYWSFSGMETSLAALGGVLLLLAYARLLNGGASWGPWLVAIPITMLYLLSRPETFAIVLATLFGVVVLLIGRRWRGVDAAPSWSGRVPRRVLGVGLVAVGSFLAILLFRLAYFGVLHPQPVSVKYRGVSRHGLEKGLGYALENLQSDYVIVTVLACVAVLGVILPHRWSRPSNFARDLCVMFYLASVGFVVVSGGDGMVGGRFFVPLTAVAVVLAYGMLHDLLPVRALRPALVIWICLQLGGALMFARTSSRSDPLWAALAREAVPGNERFHWFDKANHDHRRYFPVVPELERRIDAARRADRPVRIFSGQSGFLMYHVTKDRLGDLKYFDRFGLCTRDFSACSVSAELPRSEWGLMLHETYYLEHIDAFERACGIARPDVVFDLFWQRFPPRLAAALEAAWYRVVYSQDDVFGGDSALLPGATVKGRAYIAIRRSLITEDY